MHDNRTHVKVSGMAVAAGMVTKVYLARPLIIGWLTRYMAKDQIDYLLANNHVDIRLGAPHGNRDDVIRCLSQSGSLGFCTYWDDILRAVYVMPLDQSGEWGNHEGAG